MSSRSHSSRGRGGGGGRDGGGDRDKGGDRRDDRGGGGRGGRGGGKEGGGGRGGPSKNSMRGMSYIHPSTPSFLSAFKAQLAGGPAPTPSGSSFEPHDGGGGGGRAALPGAGRQTSEEREEQELKELRERERDDDEWGFGEGDEAPQVVVVKEGRHLTKEEMEDEGRRGTFLSSSSASVLLLVPRSSQKKARVLDEGFRVADVLARPLLSTYLSQRTSTTKRVGKQLLFETNQHHFLNLDFLLETSALETSNDFFGQP